MSGPRCGSLTAAPGCPSPASIDPVTPLSHSVTRRGGEPPRLPLTVQPGDLISGKYRLLRLLGAGGMGSVWAARNELTDRDFAIKFLLPALAQNKEALHRFFLEARACGQIKHPAVVDVYDMGQAEDGSPYLVMELLEGEGFDHRLHRSGVFRPAEAAAWIAFVARGLEEAHVRGLVHRDLKPGNIFFALDDRGDVIPKVLDFGVSKATGRSVDFVKTTTGAVLGSPAYMSPEQAKGETDVDGRSDVWSLGVILYEALTGQVPFDAPNYNALMVAIMMQPHRPVLEVAPTVPPELAQIVDHALAKDKLARIGTARELADRLEAVVARITSSPFPQFQPKITAMEAATAPRIASITQGTWSGAQRGGSRKTGPLIFVVTAVLAVGAAGGAIGFARTRQPVVAVSSYSERALQTGLQRLEHEMEQLKAQAAADAADDGSKPIVLEPSDLPPATKTPRATGAGAPPAVAKPKPRKPSKDPHGGVDGAGF